MNLPKKYSCLTIPQVLTTKTSRPKRTNKVTCKQIKINKLSFYLNNALVCIILNSATIKPFAASTVRKIFKLIFMFYDMEYL